ncbi:MAG: 30S ribosomal protein THX [Cyclobacteriaceae bacterium]
MGKGDKKTKKGKISMGSYGVKRSRKGNKSQGKTDKKSEK